jgi:hypothetical protein
VSIQSLGHHRKGSSRLRLVSDIGNLQGYLSDASRPYDRAETQKALVILAKQIVARGLR